MVLAGRLGGAFQAGGRVLDCNNRMHVDVYSAIARGFGMNVMSVGYAPWNMGPMPGLLV
jgi:hypothetical protein